MTVIPEEEVAIALEADRSLAPGQQQDGVHPFRIPQPGQVAEGVAVVGPDTVDIGDVHGIGPEQGGGLLQPAAGLQQFGALVGDDDRRATTARRQMGLQPVGEPVHIDHGAGDPGLGQPVQHVIDQGPPGQLDQGLGPVVGQGAHTGAEAGGEHHGGGGGSLGSGHRRLASGTWRSNQVATPSRPGAVRLRFRWAHMRGMKAR